jgi:hypothetical protein
VSAGLSRSTYFLLPSASFTLLAACPTRNTADRNSAAVQSNVLHHAATSTGSFSDMSRLSGLPSFFLSLLIRVAVLHYLFVGTVLVSGTAVEVLLVAAALA